MPYLHLRTSKTLTDEENTRLKSRFGQAITCLPGKTERWLMVDLEGGAVLTLGGEMRPLAMVEVALFGKAPATAYETLTAEICRVLAEELGLPGDGVYVKYEEVQHWGYDGGNF